jgi:predicted HTH transcriptional regulator
MTVSSAISVVLSDISSDIYYDKPARGGWRDNSSYKCWYALFGHSPQDHIPQSEVVCVLFRETVGASRYADRKIVTGALQDLIDNTEAFLDRYIAVGARIEGWKRIDIPEYSIEVLREAVINAVVHRDYSRRGERVRVFYYPDRVEVHSPGFLLPGITVEQMERGEVQSKLRNPVLAGLLSTIPGYNVED